mgnify:CR=1 FL=1
MFEHIIVTKELLPIRDAACNGDIDAMFTLADHIVQGKYTKQSGKNADTVIDRMYGHPDFIKDPYRAWDTYVMTVCALKLMQQEGEITYHEYIGDSCMYLQMMISCMTSAPRHMWNYQQLENCIAWIRENEPKLQEEAL